MILTAVVEAEPMMRRATAVGEKVAGTWLWAFHTWCRRILFD